MSSITRTLPGGGPVVAASSSTTTTVIVLLTAPALIWGILLLAGLAFDLAELGSFANPVVGALGIVSIIGLVGASGVALRSRIAARRPARTSGRTGRRALLLSAAAIAVVLFGGGMLAAGFATFAAASADQPAGPAVEQPVNAPLFGVDHSGH